MTTQSISKPSSTKVNLWVDLALFGAILFVLSPNFTGLSIHEWLGIALGGGIITHLLLHWDWVVATLKRFFGKLPAQARLNLILNSALFIDLTIIIFTGLMISREALPFFGISVPGGMVWRGLHTSSANLSIVLAGLHVAVHWKWILNALRKYIWAPIFNRGPKTQTTPVSPILHAEVK
jgi:hypothetical protein